MRLADTLEFSGTGTSYSALSSASSLSNLQDPCAEKRAQPPEETGQAMKKYALFACILFSVTVSPAQIRPVISGGVSDASTVRIRLTQLNLDVSDPSELSSGRVLARAVSTNNPKEMGAFGAIVAEGSPDAFVQAYPTLEVLRASQHITAIGRFSDKPSIKDLDSLTLDNGDLYALMKASPKNSDIKLSENEIARIKEVVHGRSALTPELRAELTAEYRQMLLTRVNEFILSGGSDMGSYGDKEQVVSAGQAYMHLAREQADLQGICGHISTALTGVLQPPADQTTSFFYWARERFGEVKPATNLFQVIIHHEGARWYIVSRQLYSSHYTEAGLSVAEFIPFTDSVNRIKTLVIYTVRMEVDMLGGGLGFLKKRLAQPHVVSTLRDSLNGLRVNLESASPRDKITVSIAASNGTPTSNQTASQD